jgi:hypothetical protein
MGSGLTLAFRPENGARGENLADRQKKCKKSEKFFIFPLTYAWVL